MTFKRYRVDLSNDRSASNDPESEKRRSRRLQRGIINKLVNNLGSRGDRSPKESSEGKNNPWGVVSGLVQGVFQSDTVDSTNRDNNSNSKLRKSLEARYASEVNEGALFRWVTSVDLMSENTPLIDEDFVAAAAFWRMALDIILQQSNNEKKKAYLALSETTSAVASNLCDILNWYTNEMEEDASMHVIAQLDSRSDDIPVIQFTVTNNEQQMQQLQQNSHGLPSAADTERQTKAWVTRLLVELGVCPFTKSSQKSGQGLGDMGVPVANIMYRHSDALSCGDGGVYEIMADAWEAISDMVAAGPSGKKGVSSILLSAPGFDDDFALWAGPVFAMLEAGVSAIQAEEIIGVVCFHPKCKWSRDPMSSTVLTLFQFSLFVLIQHSAPSDVVPDGKSWPGFGHMHSLPRLKNWYNQYSSSSAEGTTTPLDDDEIAAGGAFQRRTPHAVINVLRAEQLEAAEGRRSTGELYERNIRVLMGKEGGVGLEKLTNDLRLEQQI